MFRAGAVSALKEMKLTLLQLDGCWGALQRFFGKADACFRHAGGRTEDPQATAGVHSTETEEEWRSKNSLGFPVLEKKHSSLE